MGKAKVQKPKHLAKKLLAIRHKLGISQIKMAQLIQFNGQYSRLSEFESGRRIPNVLVLLAYARAVNIPLEHIVDDDIKIELTKNS